MTRPPRYHHGDQVLVYDAKGNYECRGAIVGVYACDPPQFDVQPSRSESRAKRLCGIPEGRLQSVPMQVRAYERRPEPKPRHVLDEA